MARGLGAQARRVRVVTWVVVALGAVLATEIGLSFQAPAPRPAQLLGEALTAAGAAETCHYSSVWRAGGVSQTVVGDAGPAAGSETVAVGADRFSLVFTGQVVYFDGDEAALHDQLGLRTATAAEEAGTWVVLQPTDGPYPSVDEGLTSAAALAQIVIAPSTTSLAPRSRGVVLSRITGGVPHGHTVTGSAWLDVASRSKLPVAYSAHGSEAGQRWSSTIGFSRWGENLAVHPPKGAIPFSALLAGVPGPGPTARV